MTGTRYPPSEEATVEQLIEETVEASAPYNLGALLDTWLEKDRAGITDSVLLSLLLEEGMAQTLASLLAANTGVHEPHDAPEIWQLILERERDLVDYFWQVTQRWSSIDLQAIDLLEEHAHDASSPDLTTDILSFVANRRMQDGDFFRAAYLLEEVAQSSSSADVWKQLAQALAGIQEWDRAAAAERHRAALEGDPALVVEALQAAHDFRDRQAADVGGFLREEAPTGSSSESVKTTSFVDEVAGSPRVSPAPLLPGGPPPIPPGGPPVDPPLDDGVGAVDGGPDRAILITGHEARTGGSLARFNPETRYELRFSVGPPSALNLARGDTSVKPSSGGFMTSWIVTSEHVEFTRISQGSCGFEDGQYQANFELFIPEG